MDARRIAEYAMRFFDKAKHYQRPAEELMSLKQLEAERSIYLTDMAKYKAQLSDQEGFMEDKIFKRKAKRLKEMIKSLEKDVERDCPRDG
ncbi:MAG: hypothetical protein L6U61_09025 [Bacteroidales bacterium]|nr:MAG: hypothetical protein L6U61_09025 [Bacteroidales bacterium]